MATLFKCDRCGKLSEAQQRTKLLLPKGWGQVCKVIREDGVPVELETVCPNCVLSVAGMARLPADAPYKDELPGSVDFWIRVEETDVEKLMDGRLQMEMARRVFYWLTNQLPAGIYKKLHELIGDELQRAREQDRATNWGGFKDGS